MAVTPEQTARHLRQLAQRRLERIDARAAEARALAHRAAAVLVRDHGARCVWLFGSVARGVVHERSDVDLAVELPQQAIDRAREALDGLDAEIAIDLVALESLPAAWRARIERDGERLA